MTFFKTIQKQMQEEATKEHIRFLQKEYANEVK